MNGVYSFGKLSFTNFYVIWGFMILLVFNFNIFRGKIKYFSDLILEFILYLYIIGVLVGWNENYMVFRFFRFNDFI